jgi:penicillin amidase
MQYDQRSILARRVGVHLASLESNTPYPISELFQNWDGDLAADSPAAAIYEVFIRRWLYNLFDTVAGDSLAKASLSARFVGAGPHPILAATSFYGSNGRALLAQLLDTPDSPLFQEQSLDNLMLQSLREAVEYLEWQLGPQINDWQWGALHQLTYAHPLGQVKPLDKLFNRGPFPIGGDDTTIWAAGAYYHSLESDRMVGPPCRFVVDLNDLSQSRSLNAPGQSGQPGSRHYADRIQDWFNGNYCPMLYHRQDIVAQAEATLHLQPKVRTRGKR